MADVSLFSLPLPIIQHTSCSSTGANIFTSPSERLHPAFYNSRGTAVCLSVVISCPLLLLLLSVAQIELDHWSTRAHFRVIS